MLNATLVNVMVEFKNGRGLVNFLLSVRIIALRGPSGKNLDPWPFLVLINDLYVDNLANVRKYVDDMTVSEVVAKGNRNCTLEIAHKVAEWSTQNRVHLNSEKCKELRISFVKDKPQFFMVMN